MEKIILTGKIAGKRARGRQMITFLQRIAEWSGVSGVELLQCTGNRNKWHKLAADVTRQGTRRKATTKTKLFSELKRKSL